jgi:hypothetical protein
MEKTSVLLSPKEKPFLSNADITVSGDSMDYKQWRELVTKAIHGFNFSPDNEALVITGARSDASHIQRLQHELQKLGWIVELEDLWTFTSWKLTKQISMLIFHPDNPYIMT